MGSPVWSRHGIIAVGNAHKSKVKLTFSHGASLPDPQGVFNAGLDGGTWRSLDLHEGDRIDAPALKALIQAAVDHNHGRVLARQVLARARPKARKSKTAD